MKNNNTMGIVFNTQYENIDMGSQPQQQQAQPQQQATPSQQQEMQFYTALFQILDTDKKQALSGGQVFQFFLSSQVNKAALADIWDAVKSNGVLQVRGFMTAMKLITLAQNGVKPDVNSLNNYQYVGPPRLQYPQNTRYFFSSLYFISV